jgi:alkylation response protein AidB-like acyl-CoA dehydrogenase
MDFNDTPEEAAYRAEARAWLEANAEYQKPGNPLQDPLGERIDDATLQAAKAWQKKKADAGWACIRWPAEYGGRGATAIQGVIWSQEEAKFDTPPNIFSIGHGMCGPTIMAHGTPEQRQKWLPRLLSGEEVWCQLFSEPSAGSDLAGLRMTAVRDGDEWVVNGQKTWTTGAQFCDWGILVARHDPNVAKHAGLTFFVVDMHAPGIEVRPITQINGGQGFNEVFYSDVRIPDAYRLGEVGDGWRVAITTLMNERASIGGMSGGGGGIGDLMRLAAELEIDGAAAIEDRAVRETLAGFYVRSKGVELTGRRTLSALSQGKMPGPEASLMKLVATRLIQEMAAYAVELQGTAGATTDPELTPQAGRWQERYLAIPGLRIAGGTDEVLRNIIAERVLRASDADPRNGPDRSLSGHDRQEPPAHAPRTTRRDVPRQGRPHHGGHGRDHQLPRARRALQPARPADVGHRAAPRRPRGALHGEPPALLRGLLGRHPLGPLPHHRQSLSRPRRGGLHRRRLRCEAAGDLRGARRRSGIDAPADPRLPGTLHGRRRARRL